MWAGQKDDTPFSDEAVLQEHIVVGITLVNAVNFLEECMSWFVLNALDLVGKSHYITFGYTYASGYWIVATMPR